MNIGGLQKTSLIDYPGKISAIIFTQGCNLKCGYCHNPELVNMQNPSIDTQYVLEFLKTRINKLDAVVISGGEPTIQSDLEEFAQNIKSMGFLLKLDTNGTNPQLLNKLIKLKLLDYVAMDIKAPLYKYRHITNKKCNTSDIVKSIDTIINSGVDYEFRTTVVKSQLILDDFREIGIMLKSANKYYLQEFIPSKPLDNSFLNERSCSKDEFDKIIKILNEYITGVYLR